MFCIANILSPTELILILAVVLLLFGGKKLPELMHSLGKSLNEFKKGQRDGEVSETPAAPAQPVAPAQPADAAKKQEAAPEKKA